MKKNKQEDNQKEKKVKLNKKILIPFIILSILSFISYIAVEIIYNNEILSSVGVLIGSGIIFLFTIRNVLHVKEQKNS